MNRPVASLALLRSVCQTLSVSRPFSAETKPKDPIPSTARRGSCCTGPYLTCASPRVACWLLAWCWTPATAVVGSPWQSLSVAPSCLGTPSQASSPARTTTDVVFAGNVPLPATCHVPRPWPFTIPTQVLSAWSQPCCPPCRHSFTSARIRMNRPRTSDRQADGRNSWPAYPGLAVRGVQMPLHTSSSTPRHAQRPPATVPPLP